MFNSSLAYGVPFIWDNKLDWYPIYHLIEPGQYSLNKEEFLQELDDDIWKEDLKSFQYCLDGRDLGEYLLVKHNPSDTFLIIDKNYLQYLSKDAFLKAREPKLEDYQKLVVFLNKYEIKVNFKDIGIYLLNDCTEGIKTSSNLEVENSL